jgi:hypothetical protein
MAGRKVHGSPRVSYWPGPEGPGQCVNSSARRGNAALPSATRNTDTTRYASDTNHDEDLERHTRPGRAIPAPSDDGQSSDASPAPTPAAVPRLGLRRG